MPSYKVGISYEVVVEYRVRANDDEEAEEKAYERFSKSHPYANGETMWVTSAADEDKSVAWVTNVLKQEVQRLAQK